MSKIFLIDTAKRPLNPIHPAQARQMLRNGKAAIFRRFPFTLILKTEQPETLVDKLRIKIDPGAKTTGLALINDLSGEVIFAAELQHRGFEIKHLLTSRSQLRRSRRSRKTRYRARRYKNRSRKEGWLAPSLQSRVDNILTWVSRLRKFAEIGAISQELVKFDTQIMQNPEITGKEYQQGTLAGYETREYLLEKWGRKCAYCDTENVPLQVEHICPLAKGGSNRISNLTLSCEKCNVKKGTKYIKDFLKKDPQRLDAILKQVKKPLADTAAVNTTKYALLKSLEATGLPVETGSGGLTKFNRTQQGLKKTHWIDAACVGQSTPRLIAKNIKPLLIKAEGNGNRKLCITDKFGFPKKHRPRKKLHFGFRTGDIVKAVVTKGKNVGSYIGRVAIRSNGSFDISIKDRHKKQGVSYKYCQTVHRKDGYSYLF
ncbi:RNA-guided endonuclease IscB [Trichormus sp. NMC-1]|uniref:RNA-guided endonuclease IscB n=1 Tax=Trichormus sp. NMC-1 TaxID=1853259 RepID=UPI0008DC1ECD|nr:RNA-guided endonuclease IscB [Trichormus sp. NMC-1]